ncbi:MAG: thioredoxin family protein [Proteobacteria bacterium]|jgi:peroxiredoxin|nr:thioredoxin family protein [Pseudomonadota bacterium]
MAAATSTMLALGTKAPKFDLPNTHDSSLHGYGARNVSIDELSGDNGMMVVFIGNHCPYVVLIKEALGKFSRDYCNSGIGLAAISSNDVENYPADSPANMSKFAAENDFAMPYLYDADQTMALDYGAACTPDFYLFDKNLELVYRGQFDDARPGNQVDPDGSNLRNACDALMAGREIDKNQKTSLGCNIKWRPGNEPDYF